MQKCDCQQDNQLSIYLIKMEQIEWKKIKEVALPDYEPGLFWLYCNAWIN